MSIDYVQNDYYWNVVGLDTILTWSFKARLKNDLGENYWNAIKEELWKTHNLSVSQIIQDDYSKFHRELSLIVGKKGASEIQNKCMNDIFQVHKQSEFYKLSFPDRKLHEMILRSYSDETSRNILQELSGKVKCLPVVLDEGKKNYNFNNTSFYRGTKKLIKNGLIINVHQPVNRIGKIILSVPQYTALFEKLIISIGGEINNIHAMMLKNPQENSVILNVLKNTNT